VKHPVTKLFLARIRALAAAQRAAGQHAGPPTLAGPFERHMIAIERNAAGRFAIVAAGETVASLLGRPVIGAAAASLFAEIDRPRIESMLAAAMSERVGCAFGAEARWSRFHATPVEAMLAPESSLTGLRRASVCLISFRYRRRHGARALPPLSLLSERYVELDGFAGSRESRPERHGLRAGQ